MKVNEYESFLRTTDLFPPNQYQRMFYALGMGGECGEVQEKIKKLYRDHNGDFNEAFVTNLINECGDVLWYMTRLLQSFDSNLEECMELNYKKLSSRKQRYKLHGSGDNR